ncbi:hypothetical protein PAEVO_35530 [Paenibacillus sp. GM2FR]|nr:hypothetical protein PAEVO_35530 [Paenibacillus sp. GM2FR]
MDISRVSLYIFSLMRSIPESPLGNKHTLKKQDWLVTLIYEG